MMNRKKKDKRDTRANIFRIFSVVITLLLCAGCSKGRPQTPVRLKVAATIFPLHDIAGNIVGAKADVIQVLPSGASEHTFELRPQQVVQLQGVKIVFRIGHGLDDWTNTVVEVLPDVKLVVVDKGIQLIESDEPEEHGAAEEEHYEHVDVNPHYWLSPSNGKVIARNMAEEVIRLDPGNGNYYRENLRVYEAKLDAAKQEMDAQLRNLSTRKIITFHDAWPYFAKEFGLEVVGSFEPFPGKQPTPRYLAELQQKVREDNIRVLFSEPQLSNETINALANDLGLELYIMDPLGGVEGRNSFIDLLKYNADILAEALAHG